MSLQIPIHNVQQLEELLSAPDQHAIDAMRRVPGDIILLGAGGKMGPTLARMARRATDAAGVSRRVIAVARFSTASLREQLERHGVDTIAADLLDNDQLAALPDAPNVVYMAGMKFGAQGNPGLTWAMNAWLPGHVCERYRTSRIVAFSTGNVYGLTPIALGGSVEEDPVNPQGEYAMSCLGRERIFEYFSRRDSIPVTVVRLNYACELRYGVLVDIAQQVWNEEPVDLSMGHFNALWQGDANAWSLALLADEPRPFSPVNLTGPGILSVRRVAEQFGELMGKQPRLTGSEASDALLNNAQRLLERFGPPRVSVDTLLQWIASWTMREGELLGKPTHFEVRSGSF